MSGWKMKPGMSGESLKMRQPLPIMITIATAFTQWVMRTISGWVFLLRCTGACATTAMASSLLEAFEYFSVRCRKRELGTTQSCLNSL